MVSLPEEVKGCCQFEPEIHIPCTTCGAIVCPGRQCENFCNVPGLAKRDKSVVTLEIRSKSDALGRSHFVMYWWASNFHLGPQWRAQVFFADPNKHAADLKAKGKNVRFIGLIPVADPAPSV